MAAIQQAQKAPDELNATATPGQPLDKMDRRQWLVRRQVEHFRNGTTDFHPDGARHDNTDRAQKFARQLQGRFGLPVFEVDERYSTTEAHSNGAKDADAASACIILNQFFRENL